MNKPLMVVRAPVSTRSGYGDLSRDVVRHLVLLDKWDVKVLPCPWGQTPCNALTPGEPMDDLILARMLQQPNLPRQPEIFITITVPNEFQPLGKYNIGITAGIETTGCSPAWLEGMNRMDLILTISEFSKRVLASTQYHVKDNLGNILPPLRLTKPIEVLHCCVGPAFKRLTEYDLLDMNVVSTLNEIKETFCFLFVGHWLNGDIGADRKNVGMLVKVFLETFKKVSPDRQPALILKTSGGTFSVMDRNEMLRKIEIVKSQVQGQHLPPVYLLHGDLTEAEMNSLYNHPKVKANVSFTMGEGFGRPLLEASVTGKPVIASGWSGHLDFLNVNDAILLAGSLQPIHPSAVWEGVIEKDTKWFQVDYSNASSVLFTVWKDYRNYQNRGVNLAKNNLVRFSFDAIKERTDELMTKYLPTFELPPEQVPLKLPTLKKIKPSTLAAVEGTTGPLPIPQPVGV